MLDIQVENMIDYLYTWIYQSSYITDSNAKYKI